MKIKYFSALAILSIISCTAKEETKTASKLNLQGTWQLISAQTIENGKSQVIDFSGELKMIKVINDTHFSFLKHSLNPKDSTAFDAGGGHYTLIDDNYTEHLDYYKDKNWEGKTFKFKVTLHQDTLIQKGVERVEAAKVDRVIIEKYVKVKP